MNLTYDRIKRFIDGKEYRKKLKDTSNMFLERMLNSLSSVYESSIPSTNYAILLKVFAEELARVKLDVDLIFKDSHFEEVRGEFINQNIAYLLHLGARFPYTHWSDDKYRKFFLAIIKAYFEGSKKETIEEVLSIFIDYPFRVYELFQESEKEGTTLDISDQFMYKFDITIPENSFADLLNIQEDIQTLCRIINPAHVGELINFIFEDKWLIREGVDYLFDDSYEVYVARRIIGLGQGKPDIEKYPVYYQVRSHIVLNFQLGLLVSDIEGNVFKVLVPMNTIIINNAGFIGKFDDIKAFEYILLDYRVDIKGNPIVDDKGFQKVIKNHYTAWDEQFLISLPEVQYEDTFKLCSQRCIKGFFIKDNISSQPNRDDVFTYILSRGPVVVPFNDTFNLAMSTDDIKVTINGIQVDVLDFDPWTPSIKLNKIPPKGARVIAEYYYLEGGNLPLIYNDENLGLLSQVGSTTGRNYNLVFYDSTEGYSFSYRHQPRPCSPLEMTAFCDHGFNTFNMKGFQDYYTIPNTTFFYWNNDIPLKNWENPCHFPVEEVITPEITSITYGFKSGSLLSFLDAPLKLNADDSVLNDYVLDDYSTVIDEGEKLITYPSWNVPCVVLYDPDTTGEKINIDLLYTEHLQNFNDLDVEIDNKQYLVDWKCEGSFLYFNDPNKLLNVNGLFTSNWDIQESLVKFEVEDNGDVYEILV